MSIVRSNDTAAATSTFLQSFAKHVFLPHEARSDSKIFLLLKERTPGACGERLYSAHFPSTTECIQETLVSDASCHAAPRETQCFRPAVYGSTPYWCTMEQAAAHLCYGRHVLYRLDGGWCVVWALPLAHT